MAIRTPTKRRGHYVTKSCNGCRRRRCKCDCVHPVCGTCSFYGHECTWGKEEDVPRPATKQLVEGLRVRQRELEAEAVKLREQLQGIGRNVEGRATEHNGSHSSASHERDSMGPMPVKTEEEYPGKSHLVIQDGSIIASGPTSMWATFSSGETTAEEQCTSKSDPIYQFAFCGDPTVPPHMQPRDVQLSELCEWNRHLPRLSHVEFTRLEHDTLLERCFNFHTIWLRNLVPELFLRDMLVQLLPAHLQPNPPQPARVFSYTPFLHCAILALASAFSDNPKIRAKETRDRFASYAKRHLESECENPTLTAIQALGFLADYHGGCGERGLAYMYFGMSCRVTRALGLCIDGQSWVHEKQITQEELMQRDWQFWSNFCQDKINALDYGRDYHTPVPHLNVNLPGIDPVSDQKPWINYSNRSNEAGDPQPNNGTRVFYETCKLMLIAIRIKDTLYSQGQEHWAVREEDNISKIQSLLDAWHDNLSKDLLVSSKPSARPMPHVITLNIAYWWLLLLLHRPFYSRKQGAPLQTSDEHKSVSFSDLSVRFCDHAMTKIVQLITLFDQCHGFCYFPLNMLQVVFMTGATLLVQSATLPGLAGTQRMHAYEGVRKCIRALYIASRIWDCAKVSAIHLENLLHEQIGEPPVTPMDHQRHTQQPSSSTSSQGSLSTLRSEEPHTIVPHNGYPSSHVFSEMFQDFLLQQDANMDLDYAAQSPDLQYPELRHLHEQGLMGMPSGAQFAPNPHIPPLPYYPNFGTRYPIGDGGYV